MNETNPAGYKIKNGVQEMPTDDLNQPKTSDDAKQSGKDTTE
jgi:hypothetical protein